MGSETSGGKTFLRPSNTRGAPPQESNARDRLFEAPDLGGYGEFLVSFLIGHPTRKAGAIISWC